MVLVIKPFFPHFPRLLRRSPHQQQDDWHLLLSFLFPLSLSPPLRLSHHQCINDRSLNNNSCHRSEPQQAKAAEGETKAFVTAKK